MKRWAMHDCLGNVMVKFWTRRGAERFTRWVNTPSPGVKAKYYASRIEAAA